MTISKKSSYDVFGASLFEGATFTEHYDLPILAPVHCFAENMITFSEAKNPKRNVPDAAVCFYEHDQAFRPFLRNPEKYLPMLREHPIVVGTDISAYSDMPYWMMGHNVLMNYGYAWWMSQKGLTVVPNVRAVSPLPPDATLGGIPKESTIAIGEHGNLKVLANRKRFIKEVKIVVDFLHPSNILVFGSNAYGAFDYPLELGIRVDFFPARIAGIHSGGEDDEQ